MNLLAELKQIIGQYIPVETAVFSTAPPDAYAVITPLVDTDTLFCDNAPMFEVQEVRISLFVKGNYTGLRDTLVHAIRSNDITITEKRYIDHEDNTGYNHYSIDVAQKYRLEE